jgi:peptidoglycan hydrolase-like protein with peptidoglycan-binding domain
MMAKINLYAGLLDGIVGKKLMLAVVNYQEQAGLPVTGYPDEKTIFILCHELENLKNET